MKKLLVALTVSIMFFGCMGGGGRSLNISDPDPDPNSKVNQDALCQEAIADMEDTFDAATIKTRVVKLFFSEAIEACDGLNIDYVTPIASLFATNNSIIKACGGSDVDTVKTRIEAALAATADLRFDEKFSFYTNNPAIECKSIGSMEEAEIGGAIPK